MRDSASGRPVAAQYSSRLARPDRCGRNPGPSTNDPSRPSTGDPGTTRTPEHPQLARGRPDQTHEHPQRGRLPRPVGTEQPQHLAALDPEAHVPDGDEAVAVGLGEVGDDERDVDEVGVDGEVAAGLEVATPPPRGHHPPHDDRDDDAREQQPDRDDRAERHAGPAGLGAGHARHGQRRRGRCGRGRRGRRPGRAGSAKPWSVVASATSSRCPAATVATTPGRVTVTGTAAPSGGSAGRRSGATAEPSSTRVGAAPFAPGATS